MNGTCGINCAPLVLNVNLNNIFIALSGYANIYRTLGALNKTNSIIKDNKNTKTLNLKKIQELKIHSTKSAKSSSRDKTQQIKKLTCTKGAKLIALGIARGEKRK